MGWGHMFHNGRPKFPKQHPLTGIYGGFSAINVVHVFGQFWKQIKNGIG